MSEKVSDFESHVAYRKQQERKARQQTLLADISEYKCGIMSFGTVLRLSQFFQMEDPSDGDLLVATRLIRECIADSHRLAQILYDAHKPDEA